MPYRGLRAGPANARPAKAGHYVLLAAASVLILTGLWRAESVVAQAPAAAPAVTAANSSTAVLKQVLRHVS